MRKFEFRPWGWFITLDEGKNYKVMKIYLKPNTQLSMQYHNHRTEDWVIVEGSGFVSTAPQMTVGIIKPCAVGDKFPIPLKNIHRAPAGDDGLLFIEVQRGECREDDIIRLQDDYGRVDKPS